MNLDSNAANSESQIDLRELWNILWSERWQLTGFTVIFLIASITYVLLKADIYRAEAVLAPAETRQSGNPLTSQLGGAAALIGIDVGTQDGGRITNALAILRSRDFISRFIKSHDILVPLFAGEWDHSHGGRIDPDIYDVNTKEWLRDSGEPTELEAYRAFSENLLISQDPVSGIVRVAFDWHDPELAAVWVNQMIADINQRIKASDVEEASDAIAYLRSQLETTQLVEMQRVFYQLIETQTRVTMLADVRDEYVFQVIDPAVVSDQKIAPQRMLIIIIGTLAGGMISLMYLFLRRAFKLN